MADDEAEAWTGERATRWLRQAAGLERQLAPVSDVLFAAANLRAGEAVLDVGCGTGPTTYAAALAVGPTGRVCGLDISAEMLAAAAASDPGAGIEWLQADAVVWEPEAARFDAVISRFGVMFFSDPLVAFTHLAHATRAGGRLAIAVWQRRDMSTMFSVSLGAALEALRTRGINQTAAGVTLDEFVAVDDEGPFSLHDEAALRALLSGAGWSDIAIEPHVLALPFAGGVPPAAAAKAALDFGPTRLVLSGIDDDVLHAAESAIASAFGSHLDDQGNVVLSGSVNMVTASLDLGG
jgi:SAM-dependent methyltransferase